MAFFPLFLREQCNLENRNGVLAQAQGFIEKSVQD
jgi:hypothetical protein